MSMQPFAQEYTYDLTVVTVCFRACKLLPHVIANISPLLKNPELRVEYLIVDGASDDGTVDLITAEQAAGHITRFVSEPDKGLYDAMNKAIALARGKICVFINADDEIIPQAVLKCCAPILSGAADLVCSTANVVPEDTSKPWFFVPHMDDYLYECPCNHQAMYYSTDLLREMGGYRHEQYKILADADLTRRIINAGKRVRVVDVVSAVFRLGGCSSSLNNYLEYIRFLEDSLPQLAELSWQGDQVIRQALARVRNLSVNYIREAESPLPEECQRRLISFVRSLYGLYVSIPADEDGDETNNPIGYFSFWAWGKWPIFTVSLSPKKHECIYRIFGLPLLKIRKSVWDDKKTYVGYKVFRLFCVLPLWKRTRRDFPDRVETRHFLFAAIPVATCCAMKG